MRSAYEPDLAALADRVERVKRHLVAARERMLAAYPNAPDHLREPLARSFAELEADAERQREHRKPAVLDGVVLTPSQALDFEQINGRAA